MKKKITFILFIILLINLTTAANIGISPASVKFEKVLRGGYAERQITISTNSEEKIKINISFAGENSDWLNLEKKEFEFDKNSPIRIVLSVTPPEDTPNGNYSAFMRVSAESNGVTLNQQAVSTIKTTVDVAITTEIVDYEIRDCLAKNFFVSSVEKGENSQLEFILINRGNVIIRPEVYFKIWDLEQKKIMLEKRKTMEETVKPTSEKKVISYIETKDLDIGQYWIEVTSLDCYNKEMLTFDILEQGALRTSGYIKEIIVEKDIFVKETGKIIIIFKNDGEKKIEKAKFRGTISLDNKIVNVLESDYLEVKQKEEIPIILYFTPKKAGNYRLTGNVYYDGKKTFEKSKLIIVKKKHSFDYINMILYLLVIFLILYLIKKIKKEKEKW